MNEKNQVSEIIDAVAKLTENIPVYQDLVQPAAIEMGKNIHTVSKVVTAALAPVRGLVWGFERIESYLSQSLTKKLEKTPDSAVDVPPTNIAGPVFEAMRFTSEDAELQNMFANLLANSMDRSTKSNAHPAFVEILKNINSDEAKILKFISEGRNGSGVSIPIVDQAAFYPKRNGVTVIHPLISAITYHAGCNCPELVATYLSNLIRLGIFTVSDNHLVKDGIYDQVEQLDIYHANKLDIENMQQHLNEPVNYRSLRRSISLTTFGKDLLEIAVRDKA
ncbi:DUF4393 domain-containing protein [Aeromonas hydrophila]|uniref:DUF4393 domain-containing protein n=1 Tax=Aeromonas hydrophila TaxID=644 RepID=UPI00191534F7|nr:DUF4393 domain-containing protein [Aeromonas hydrophila]MBQ4678393.1 DUF4393 domain-containing protein [Aeromonas hydrophila]MBW3815733.1 DUF4393 domain-containing protein [Aeromonas hydrophila]MCF7679926.1 DUF4393 domain-containing protein [Aeromonas hydrophila]MCF7692831.1 DUF4393 domain-containing protein [Aeromonas hydrophila]MCF7775078.1 DUF4393 domain-containing protein [Aeromonas hydrophila]